MAQNVARLGVVLGIDTAEFVKGLGDATLKLSKFVDAMKPAIAIGGAAMTGLIAKTIAYADRVTDLADANDMAVSTVMGLSSALAVSGGKAENAGKMLSTLSTSIDKVVQGVEGAEKPFQRLGISIEEIASSSTEQLLKRTADALSKVSDATTRNALARDIFSKAGMNISWDQFSQKLEEQSKKFADSEQGIRDMAEAADMLQVIWGDLMASIAKGVGSNIKEAIEYFSQFKIVIEAVGTVFKYVFQTISVMGADVAFVFQQIIGAFSTLGEVLSDPLNFQKNAKLWEQYSNNAKIARYDLEQFQEQVLKGQGGGSASKVTEQINRQIQLNDKQKEMLRVASLISAEYERQQNHSLAQLGIRNAMAGATNNERRVQEAINQVLNSTSQKIDEITKKREDAAGRGGLERVVAEYDVQIAKIKEMQDTYINAARTVEELTIANQMTFEYGWNKAFNQFAEDAQNYGRLAEDMFSSFTGNMNKAIDDFVEKGKFSFSNFAQSVIKDIIKIQLRMQAAQLMSSAFGFGASFFGGGGTGFGTATMSESAVLAGRTFTPLAAGGLAEGGLPHLVGENGPELFIPQRSGTIVPNQRMNSQVGENGGGGLTVNGTYIQNMSAIDTQSATQFLAKNKNAVWSANQSASRGMPTSR